MRRLGLVLLGLVLVTLASGCGPNVPNPIGVGPNRLALLLDEQGAYHSIMNKPGRIYLTDKEASFVRELSGVHNPIGWLRLSPNGRWLLYVSAEEFKAVEGKDYVDVESWSLRLYDLASQTESRLVESKGEISAPSFSPQEDKVAYLLDETQTPSLRLHILDLASGEEEVVERAFDKKDVREYVWAYSWSNDGRVILLLRYYYEPEEDDEQGMCSFAHLEFYALGEEEEGELEVGPWVLLPLLPLALGLDPPSSSLLDWSPDGRKIVLMACAPILSDLLYPQLYLIEFDDNELVSIKLLAENAFSPSFSPQGDKIAFIGVEGPIHLDPNDDPDDEGSSNCQEWIYLSDDKGGDLRKLVGPGCFSQLFWVSAEELGHVEETGDGATIWIYNIATGERFDLTATLVERLKVKER
ncbi:MAG: TolB family protein [Candidatus Bipolaricaulia bacterium]